MYPTVTKVQDYVSRDKGGETVTLFDLEDAVETYLQGIEVFTRVKTTIKSDNRNTIITTSYRQWEPFKTGDSK
jgi:hypothetical protein